MRELSYDEAKGLPKTNKFCESVFGFFDRLLRTNPSLSTQSIESFAMWTFNQTGQWLGAKSDKERADIIAQTKKDMPRIRAAYRERQEKIATARRENLERRKEETEKRQRAKAAEVTTLSVNIQLIGGPWDCDADVDAAMLKLAKSKKTEILSAFKTQLNYRRKVLEQKLTNPKLWNMSEAGKAFAIEQLEERFKFIIRQPL